MNKDSEAIQLILTETIKINARLDKIEARLDGLELRMDKLETYMGNVERKMDLGFIEVNEHITFIRDKVFG
jgi:hypothetical protein